jgi:colicin import membrane protein
VVGAQGMVIGQAGMRPRAADGWGPGLMLAIGVHLMLVAALALGVQWKISNPDPIEAEIWSEIPRAAEPEATQPPPPAPAPEVPPTPTPAPEPVKVEPAPEPVPEVVVAKVPPKKKEEPKKKRKEPVEIFDSTPPKPSSKDKTPPKPVESKPAKTPPSKVTAVDTKAQEAAEREAQRQANIKRMLSDAGTVGSGAKAAGPTAAYAGRIKARIKPNIVFTEEVSGNPAALVEVRCAPDGRIMSRKLLESSGIAAWDEAVLRAVDRTETLPPNEEGKVPGVIQLYFKPKDF